MKNPYAEDFSHGKFVRAQIYWIMERKGYSYEKKNDGSSINNGNDGSNGNRLRKYSE